MAPVTPNAGAPPNRQPDDGIAQLLDGASGDERKFLR